VIAELAKEVHGNAGRVQVFEANTGPAQVAT